MQDVPDSGENLPRYGNLNFHLALSTNDSLMITELVEEASLRFGCGPGAFDKSFSQVSVSVSDAPGLDFSSTFLVTGLQSTPGYKVGGVLE